MHKKSVDEICEYLGADSLTYLGLEELKEACGYKDQFCAACFDGKYPMEVPINDDDEL